VRAPFNQVVQVAGTTCSAERSEERTNAMVRAPVKGARMRPETSESSRSTDEVDLPRFSGRIELLFQGDLLSDAWPPVSL